MAKQAYDFGLIDQIVDPQDLLPTARNLVADSLAAKPEIARRILEMCQET